jgi:hypothetical protein
MHIGQPAPDSSFRTLIGYCMERDTLSQSTKTALVVGTLLAFINHGGDILSRHLSWHWVLPVLLTYLVPFGVAMSGVVYGKLQQHKAAP